MPAANLSRTHTWVAATTIEVSTRQACNGTLRGFLKIPESTRVDIMEVYCSQCRRGYDEVAGEPCNAPEGTEHLRGGPIGERMKRKGRHPYHDCLATGCEHADPQALHALRVRNGLAVG